MAEKVTRDAFLYEDPEGSNTTKFAQCSTCMMRVPQSNGSSRCSIHGPKVVIRPNMSCGLYVVGKAMPLDHETMPRVTPVESGLVERDVRCENCRFYDPDDGECELYEALNEALPTVFDLDPYVNALGCCNAQTPIGADGRVGEALEKLA